MNSLSHSKRSVDPLLRSLLAVIGIVLASLLLKDHLAVVGGKGMSSAFCDASPHNGCRTVALSPYAEIVPGIPVALLALAFFAAQLVVSIYRGFRSSVSHSFDSAGLAFQTLSALASLVYLSIMFFVLRKFCVGCLSLHAVNFGLLFLNARSVRKPLLSRSTLLPLIALIALQGLFAVTLFYSLHLNRSVSAPEYQVEVDHFRTETSSRFRLSLGTEGETIPLTMAIDLACPYCKENLLNLTEALTTLRRRAEVSLILFPMDSECNPNLGVRVKTSCTATRMAICEAEQNRFSEFLRGTLLQNVNVVDDLEAAASLHRSDPDEQKRLIDCANSDKTRLILREMTNPYPGGTTEALHAVPTTWLRGLRFTGKLNSHEWVQALEGKIQPAVAEKGP